jgi:hypothetical protein
VSKVTELASSAITAVDSIIIELVEANETPAVIIIRWPVKATVTPAGSRPPLTPLLESLLRRL